MEFILIKNVTNSYTVIDRKRGKILNLENGIFSDITKKCYNLYKKEKNWDNKKSGTTWYQLLHGEIENDFFTIFLTDKQKDFDIKIFEIQKKQLCDNLIVLNYNLEKLKKDKQYYTYELSNI